MTTVPTDIAIAQAAKLRPIADVARELGLADDEVEFYGRYKAKISLQTLERRKPTGRLVLVTGINPTPAGEGKSTVTVGVTQALRKLGKKALLCIREPSLGPVFGVKGGAAGGGYAQVVPMEDINLHFTGDFHAIASARIAMISEPGMMTKRSSRAGPPFTPPRPTTMLRSARSFMSMVRGHVMRRTSKPDALPWCRCASSIADNRLCALAMA